MNLQNYWILGTHDLFEALKGEEMKVINDNAILDTLRAKFSKTSEKTGKVSTAFADSAFRTYRNIRHDGWQNTKNLMSKSTFNDHVKMLCECGLSRAALQNMTGLEDSSKIIPFVRFISVDFGAQFPDWYDPTQPKYTREMFLDDEGSFDFVGGLERLINQN